MSKTVCIRWLKSARPKLSATLLAFGYSLPDIYDPLFNDVFTDNFLIDHVYNCFTIIYYMFCWATCIWLLISNDSFAKFKNLYGNLLLFIYSYENQETVKIITDDANYSLFWYVFYINWDSFWLSL